MLRSSHDQKWLAEIVGLPLTTRGPSGQVLKTESQSLLLDDISED